MDQTLQQRLEMARRQTMARRQRLCGDRRGSRVKRHVHDGGDRQETAPRQQVHPSSPPVPVDPKPAEPRSLLLNAAASANATRATADTTSCATRAPRIIENG